MKLKKKNIQANFHRPRLDFIENIDFELVVHDKRVNGIKAAFIMILNLIPAAPKQRYGQDTAVWGFVFQLIIFACHLCSHTNSAISHAF